MTDGWHSIGGYRVYVENNRVIRGVVGEYLGTKTAYPYRRDRRHKNLWDNVSGLTCNAFKSGVKRGTIKLF